MLFKVIVAVFMLAMAVFNLAVATDKSEISGIRMLAWFNVVLFIIGWAMLIIN